MCALNYDEALDPILARALSVLTTRVHLDINFSALELCQPVVFVDSEKAPCAMRAAGSSGSSVTWCPAGSRLFTLLRTKRESLVYCHDNDTLYHASPEAALGPDGPLDVGFLAQYYEDPGTVPRVMIFDLVCNELTEELQNPVKRGEKLRSFSRVFPSPLCSVQWVGYVEPLRKFIGTLPHNVECFVELTKDPYRLIRMQPW